jgi:ADP-heptose:LPS heptosyltransferase
MISMDSANMHLASLYGVPVISIWGATHPFAGFLWTTDGNYQTLYRQIFSAGHVQFLVTKNVTGAIGLV